MKDIINNKRSLREVLPKSQATSVFDEGIRKGSEPVNRIYSNMSSEYQERKSFSFAKILAVLVVIVLAVIVAYAISSAFTKVTVKIVPRQASLTTDNTFAAARSNPEGLEFGVVSDISDSAKIEVPATGIEKVEQKASGKVVIYNAYSSAAQTLVKSTRLSTPDGKIYRIQQAVVVPGLKKVNGTDTPGSVEVLAVADQPGDSFNIGASDFKIPGFVGNPRYDKFYARAKDGMTGGFAGERKKVSPQDLDTAKQKLTAELKSRILAQAKAKTPANFVMFDDAAYLEFGEPEVTNSTSADMAVITEKVNLSGIIFDREKFSRFIAKNLISDYDNGDIRIDNMENLRFALIDRDKITPATVENISFSLVGQPHFTWQIAEKELKNKLISADNKSYQQVFAEFPAIDRAEISFNPPWIHAFPKDDSRVQIEYSKRK